jgi:hypothetical protein
MALILIKALRADLKTHDRAALQHRFQSAVIPGSDNTACFENDASVDFRPGYLKGRRRPDKHGYNQQLERERELLEHRGLLQEAAMLQTCLVFDSSRRCAACIDLCQAMQS